MFQFFFEHVCSERLTLGPSRFSNSLGHILVRGSEKWTERKTEEKYFLLGFSCFHSPPEGHLHYFIPYANTVLWVVGLLSEGFSLGTIFVMSWMFFLSQCLPSQHVFCSVCSVTSTTFKYILRSLECLYHAVAKHFIFQIALTYLNTNLPGNLNAVVKGIYF